MKRMFVATVLASVAVALAAAHGAENKPAQDTKAAEEEVRQLREQWGKAILARDVPALERVLADEFTHTDPNGKASDKKAYLASIRSLTLESGNIEDEKVSVYGDVALVMVRATLRGKNNDVDISGTFREMDVVVKRDGPWQVVGVQTTRITQP